MDDCVKINQKPLRATDQPRVMEKGWIKEIKVMVFGEDAEIILIVDKPKKNGTRSLIGAERFYNIKLDEVEVINK